jgi:hypothetical protein
MSIEGRGWESRECIKLAWVRTGALLLCIR